VRCMLTGGDVLRRGVAVRADDPRRDVRSAGDRAVLGEPEVRQLRRVIHVEEDVGCLEIPVYDLPLRRVQEGEAASCSDCDLEP
jgi:hypothetical protein